MTALVQFLQLFFDSLKQYSRDTFSSLRVRNYRLYYLGQIVSTSGTFMQSIAQDWLVLKLSNSGTALGIVTALQYVPVLFLAPYGGVIADRFSKRKILLITQSVSGILALILGTLVATGLVQLWMVFILAFCLGLTSSFDTPTRQSFVVELVGEEDLKNAVTLYSTLVNLSRIIGPAIAAAIIGSIGLALCFILNGLSYGAVVIMLLWIRASELKVGPRAERSPGQLREGFQYVLGSPILRNILIMLLLIGALTFEFQVSLPLIARFTFHGDAGSYASLSMSLGLGAVIGGLLIAGQKKVSPDKLAKGALRFGLAILVAASMPNMPLAMLALVVVGVFSITFTSMANSVLQLQSSPQMRGRVMSFWTLAFLGSSTLGGPIIGWAGEYLGPRWALGVSGMAAVAAAAIGWKVLSAVTAQNREAERVAVPRELVAKEKRRG